MKKLLIASIVMAGALFGYASAATADNTLCGYDETRRLENASWAYNGYNYIYQVNRVSVPDSGPSISGAPGREYNRDRFTARIRSGANTWTFPRTRCGFPRGSAQPMEVARDTAQPFTTASARDYNDDHNTVDFGPAVDNRLLECGAPALACTHLRTTKLEIREVDIRMNTRYEWWSGIRQVPESRPDSFDLWSVAAHEFGHGLSIAHVTEDRDNTDPWKRGALMFPSFARREARRSLAGYDWNALCVTEEC